MFKLNQILLILLVGFVLYESKGQNLIKNPSFENYTVPIDCNGGGFEIAGFPTFHHVVDDWHTFNSPDYFNAVCNVSTSYYNVPNNIFGFSYAKTRNSYAGIMPFTPNGETKEYLHQQLTTPLKQDSIYCLSFYTTRADRTPYAIKSLGAYFSINTPTLITNYYVDAMPHVVNQNGFITDTIEWTEIRGCFTAQGGEQYITIGNFNSNANTDTLQIQSNNPLTGTGNNISYYYIDSVSLWKNNFPTSIKEQSNEGMIKVYPNPTVGYLTLALSNISASLNAGIEGIGQRDYMIKIYDIVGREVKALVYQEEIDISDLEKGIYFLSLYQNKQLIGTKKVIKN